MPNFYEKINMIINRSYNKLEIKNLAIKYFYISYN